MIFFNKSRFLSTVIDSNTNNTAQSSYYSNSVIYPVKSGTEKETAEQSSEKPNTEQSSEEEVKRGCFDKFVRDCCDSTADACSMM